MATVSVIITSYNYARYIGAAVQSVLDQTYRDLEIVVVDDGSTDETLEVLRHFENDITIICQENSGKSVALNRGIAATQGRYLAFLDSDDCWRPDAVARRMAAFEQDEKVGVVYGRTNVIDASGKLLPYANGSPDLYPGDPFRSLLCGVYIPFLTFMVRRSDLDRVGPYFDPAFGAVNDWELFLRLARVCRFAYIDEPLAYYRVHGANWSRNAAAMGAEMTRVVHKVLSAPDLPEVVQRTRATILRNLYTNVGLGFVSIGNYRLAMHYLSRALSSAQHPSWALVRIVYLIAMGYLRRHPAGAAAVEALGRVKQRANYAVARWKVAV